MKNAHHALPTATFLLLGLFILLSCDRAPANFENGDDGTIVEMSARPARQSLIATRKLIRIAHLELEMKDIAVAKTEIEKLIKEFNAFTESEAIDHLPSRLQHQQTIRVPVDKFELLLGKLESLSVKV